MYMNKLDKRSKLLLGLLFDLMGMASFVFPWVDIVWAPLSAYLMIRMYEGSVGKIGGLVSFLEEALPGLDFFPSFTLTWIYVHLLKKGQPT